MARMDAMKITVGKNGSRAIHLETFSVQTRKDGGLDVSSRSGGGRDGHRQ